jgi:thioredoxin 1
MSLPNEVLHPNNSAEFEKILQDYPDSFIFVDVFTDWCGPCKRFAPIFVEVQQMYKDKAVFAKLNLEHAREIGEKYRITAIPTLLFIKSGNLIDQVVGAMPKGQFVTTIDKILG